MYLYIFLNHFTNANKIGMSPKDYKYTIKITEQSAAENDKNTRIWKQTRSKNKEKFQTEGQIKKKIYEQLHLHKSFFFSKYNFFSNLMQW